MALYIIEYVPTTFIFTVPDVVTVIVSPLLSVAVAPASVYVVASSTVNVLLPVITITGMIFDPGNSTSSEPVTILLAIASVSFSPRTSLEIVVTKSSSSACEIISTWSWLTWLEVWISLSLNTSAIIVEIFVSVVVLIVAPLLLLTISVVAVVSVTTTVVSPAIRLPSPLNNTDSLFSSSDNIAAVSIIVAIWTLALCDTKALVTTSTSLLSKSLT